MTGVPLIKAQHHISSRTAVRDEKTRPSKSQHPHTFSLEGDNYCPHKSSVEGYSLSQKISTELWKTIQIPAQSDTPHVKGGTFSLKTSNSSHI